VWVKDFKILQLDRETRIKDILQKLLIIKDQVKVEKKTHRQGQENNKHLRNNGGHEWDDCHKNPKNKNKDRNTHNDTDNRDNRGKGQRTSNCSSREETEMQSLDIANVTVAVTAAEMVIEMTLVMKIMNPIK
jgi:hypothetical protein